MYIIYIIYIWDCKVQFIILVLFCIKHLQNSIWVCDTLGAKTVQKLHFNDGLSYGISKMLLMPFELHWFCLCRREKHGTQFPIILVDRSESNRKGSLMPMHMHIYIYIYLYNYIIIYNYVYIYIYTCITHPIGYCMHSAQGKGIQQSGTKS